MKKTFVVLAAALSMSSAFAQSAAAPAAPSSAAIEAHAAAHEQRVEERIAYLHTTLKITPEQEPLWKTFADQMRSNSQSMADLFRQRAENANTRSALDDMKQYAQLTQAHAEDMQKLVAAFEPLYNGFSTDQKAIADKAFRHGPEHGSEGGQRPKSHRKPHAKPAAAASAASAPAAQ